MALVRISTRKAYRAVLEDVRDRYVAALKRWGPAGGSLWAQVARIKIRLKRWGGVWPVSETGKFDPGTMKQAPKPANAREAKKAKNLAVARRMKLTWLVRGTSHQPARPVDVHINEKLAADLVNAEAAELLDRYDQEAR